ncbi:hypothetical protein FPOG_02539, partial [Fusobacterium periodonticum D10]
MTTEEREIILNLSYEELIEKFKNEPRKVIKFLQDEQKKDVGNDTGYIIEKLITLIMIIIEDYYLEDDSFNEFLIKLACDKRHYQHEDLAFLLEKKHSPKL